MGGFRDEHIRYSLLVVISYVACVLGPVILKNPQEYASHSGFVKMIQAILLTRNRLFAAKLLSLSNYLMASLSTRYLTIFFFPAYEKTMRTFGYFGR